jgi:hypothetical protein
MPELPRTKRLFVKLRHYRREIVTIEANQLLGLRQRHNVRAGFRRALLDMSIGHGAPRYLTLQARLIRLCARAKPLRE